MRSLHFFKEVLIEAAKNESLRRSSRASAPDKLTLADKSYSLPTS